MTSQPVRHARHRAWPVAVAGIALATALTACGGPTAAPHFSGGGSELDAPLSAAVKAMSFTDESGHTMHLADYAGKMIVLGDILTLCQEHCPIDTAAFVQLARQYAKAAHDPTDTVFLSITVDPERDTPAQLAAYREMYVGGASKLPRWHLLTGSPADLAKLWQVLHVYVQKVGEDGADEVVRNWRTGERLTYDVDHSDIVYFIDSSGREQYLFNGQPYLHGADIPPQMQRFMTAEGHHNEKTGAWTADDGLKVLDWMHHSSP